MALKVLGKGKAVARQRRHLRLRKKIKGTTARPRLVVTRSSGGRGGGAGGGARARNRGGGRRRRGRPRHATPRPHLVPLGGYDTAGKTVVPASRLAGDLRALDADKTAKAHKVGELVAARAKAAGIESVVFDRGGNKYHGRVAAVADGAREAGLEL
jgi:large subunit ribosomal protein L18